MCVHAFRVAVLVLALLMPACGDQSPTSPSPTPAPSGPTNLSVSIPRELLNMGDTMPASVSPTVAGTWSTEPAGIAEITTSGQITGISAGRTTVVFTATSNGARGSAPLRVVPAFNGNWTGIHRVTFCEQSGGWLEANACSELQPNREYSIQLQLQQVDDQVTGRLRFDAAFSESFSAHISDDGHVRFRTTIRDGDVTVDVRDADIVSTEIGRITGAGFNTTWTQAGVSGDARTASVIVRLTR